MKDDMEAISVWTRALGDEQEDRCPCCERPLYEGEGLLESGEGELAHYGYRWAEGHGVRFTLGIRPSSEEDAAPFGLAVVTCHGDAGQLVYTVLEPDQSPWGDSAALGKILTRKQLLDERVIPDLFDLVDAIAANEPRIASRVLAGSKEIPG